MGFTNDQKYSYSLLESGENVFLTGWAGTGKTYVLQKFIEAHKKEIAVCSPTGIAANLIDGVTIHRLFGLSAAPCPKAGKKHLKVLEGCRTLVIDEISLVRLDIFSYVAQIVSNMEKKLSRHIQVVVCGDFAQLPPVVTKNDARILRDYYGGDVGNAYAFQAPEWDQLNFKAVVLKEIIRQKDEKFLKMLNRIREGDLQAAYSVVEECAQHDYDPDRMSLCSTNAAVSRINEMKLTEIQSPMRIYDAVVSGDVRKDEIVCEERLCIKEGCRVMLLVNLSEKRVNGMMGRVISIKHNLFTDRDEIRVNWDRGGFSVISQYTWTTYRYTTKESPNGKTVEREACGTVTQIPLKLAYAITVHKSQGQTFDSVNLVLDTVFAPGQLYTALTRVRSFEGLYIAPGMRINALADPVVSNFYHSLQAAEHRQQTDQAPKKVKVETRGRKSTWRGEKTVIIRVPARLAERLKAEAHRLLEEEMAESEDYSLINH